MYQLNYNYQKKNYLWNRVSRRTRPKADLPVFPGPQIKTTGGGHVQESYAIFSAASIHDKGTRDPLYMTLMGEGSSGGAGVRERFDKLSAVRSISLLAMFVSLYYFIFLVCR